MDCLFCKIVNGEIPSKTVYEDEIVKVFLDVSPASNGHCLVVPKKHFQDIEDIDLETLNHINVVTKKLYLILKEKLKCKGLTRIQNNGLGQEIKHYHLHLVPRYEQDNIELVSNKEILKQAEEIIDMLKD